MKEFCYDYPRPAYSVDAAIVSKQDRKILLIKRKNDPFANKWAFPGGFMDMNETPEQAVVRELEEETSLKGVELSQFKTYGSINRDPRERVISTLYYGFVDRSVDNIVVGMDDAAEAQWFSLHNVPELAFDHDEIFTDLLIYLKRIYNI